MKYQQHEWPFRHWVIDDFVGRGIAKTVYDDLMRPGSLGQWVEYANDDERKRTTIDFRSFGPTAEALAQSLLAEWMVGRIEGVTGVDGLAADPTWHGGGYHVTEAGGHLGPHIDYALNPKTGMERRVNLILFLSPEWRKEWGGALCLWNDDATEIQARIYPAFNRAVLWCPGDTTFHSVEPVAADAPPRVSLACYYVTPPRPGTNRKRALFIPQRAAM